MRFNYVCVTTELVTLCTQRSNIVFPIGKYKDDFFFTLVRHVTGWDKDYLRKIPRVVW
jgi:hypothetical protein